MKLKAALLYKLSFLWRSVGIYLGFFLLFAGLFPALAVIFSNAEVGTVYSDLMIPAMIYMMIIAIVNATSDFNLFIQCGASRMTIFLTNVIANLTAALGLSLILVAIERLFNGNLVQHLYLDFSVITAYTQENIVKNWLLLSLFLFLASGIGQVAGLVLNRFTGYARLIIGAVLIGVGTLMILLFQLLPSNVQQQLIDFLMKIFGITESGLRVLPLSVTIFVVVALLLGLAYLMNRRREIKRINAA